MNGVLILFGIFALLAIAVIHVYRSAELHTIHKTRAAFECRKHQIQEILENAKGEEKKLLEGELKELEIDEAVLDKEESELNNGKFFL